jgi:MuDR family transposase
MYVHNTNYTCLPIVSRPTSSGLPDPYVLGTIFKDINQAKDALLLHTVAKGLSYRPKSMDKRKYIVECLSEEPGCNFRLRFTVQNGGTAKTTVLIPHTCPPETHFGWKQASSAKYLSLAYRSNADGNSVMDPRKIQAAEAAHGNRISYMESWRASRSVLKAHASEKVGSVRRDPNHHAAPEASSSRPGLTERAGTAEAPNPTKEARVYDNPTAEILREDEVDAELAQMIQAGASCKELRLRREKLMAPRWKALDKVHTKWLLDRAKENGTIPPPHEDKFVTPETLGLFCVLARFRRQ